MKTIGNSQFTIARFIILALLLILLLIKVTPGYLRGEWSWQDLPKFDQVKNLQNLKKGGLNIPEWKTIVQEEIKIGGSSWSGQILEKAGQKPITLLLKPETYYKNEPEVEWVDVKGLEKWKTDSQDKLKFTLDYNNQKIPVTANFFRAWTDKKTYAIVQWYAMPNKGHFAPSQWFWNDLSAQLNGQRVPWIAVSLNIEIEPLGDIAKTKPLAESLAKIIQEQLVKIVFKQ